MSDRRDRSPPPWRVDERLFVPMPDGRVSVSWFDGAGKWWLEIWPAEAAAAVRRRTE